MYKDTIYRDDAIKAINARSNWYQVTCNGKQIAVMLMAKDVNEILEKLPSADRPQKIIAQITFDEEKLREIVKEAVERFKEEYEITDRPSGEWIDCGSYYKCPFCEEIEFESDGKTNFCPNCGARMREINNE